MIRTKLIHPKRFDLHEFSREEKKREQNGSTNGDGSSNAIENNWCNWADCFQAKSFFKESQIIGVIDGFLSLDSMD